MEKSFRLSETYKTGPGITSGPGLYFVLELGLDRLVVVGVGAACTLAEDLALGDLGHEHHVAAQVFFVQNLAGEHGVGGACDVVDAVGGALGVLEVLELVHVTGGLHTEMADGLKGNIFGEDADVKLAGLLDDLSGLVAHLDGNGQVGGLVCHLHAGVRNKAVVLVVLCGDDKETVA